MAAAGKDGALCPRGHVVVLAAEVGEGGSSQITQGFVSQLEESELHPLGEWGRAEIFEQEVL